MRAAKEFRKSGFTILEIIVVATIIGLLASIALPAFTQSRQSAMASRAANDLQKFADKFVLYNLTEGVWPTDGLPSTIPSGMEADLASGGWTGETPLGGQWDWDYNTRGFTAGVSVENATANDETLLAVDLLLDDGDLSTGRVIRISSTHFTFVLEQ